MESQNLAATVDIDRQYLENIRLLRSKIDRVRHQQHEISRSLENIRYRVQLVVQEMRRCRPGS